MAGTVWAIYENGVLRLLEPLDLQDGQRVCIQVLRAEPDDQARAVREESQTYTVVAAQETELDQSEADSAAGPEISLKALLQRLVQEGHLRPLPGGPVPADPVPEKERLELANVMGRAPGKPLSEIVTEERGEW